MKQPMVFGHRGASAYAPENTLPAFALAIEQGADGVELDVHLTRDNELVVIHDEDVRRTTNGTGLVKDYTLAELQALCADNGMSGFAEARIPTLQQVLDLIKPSNLLVNIELKTGILWYDGIEEKALHLVEQMGMQERVIWSSFNHYSVGKGAPAGPQAPPPTCLPTFPATLPPMPPPTASAGCTRPCTTSRCRAFCSAIWTAGSPCGSGPSTKPTICAGCWAPGPT